MKTKKKGLVKMSDDIVRAFYAMDEQDIEVARKMLLDWLSTTKHTNLRERRTREVENAKTLVALQFIINNFDQHAQGNGEGRAMNTNGDGIFRGITIQRAY